MRNVLIADPDRESAELLAQALSIDDCHIELLSQGSEVLRMISAAAVDVVITEVHLADMPAWRLIPEIHRFDPEIAVIAITSDDSWETSRRVRIEGGPVVFYGLKPLDLREMRKVVSSAMRWKQRRSRFPGKSQSDQRQA